MAVLRAGEVHGTEFSFLRNSKEKDHFENCMIAKGSTAYGRLYMRTRLVRIWQGADLLNQMKVMNLKGALSVSSFRAGMIVKKAPSSSGLSTCTLHLE